MAGIVNLIDELNRKARAQALARWVARTEIREDGLRKVSQSGIGAADPVEQREAHMRHELAKANLRFQERIIGSTIDFSFAAPGERASRAAAPVARLVRLVGAGYAPAPIATGFMVAPGLLMTNHHVFPRVEETYQAAANFGYIRDERGELPGIYFNIDPRKFFFADPDLDIALVGVSETGTAGEALVAQGTCRMIANPGKILTGMPVNIIQHPDGRPRTFAVTNNRLLDILPQGFLHYETDTLQGSSGSPLFNQDWELIGVHHTGIPKIDNGEVMTRDNHPFDPDNDTDSDIDWIANEGARVSAIVRTLGAALPGIDTGRALLQTLLSNTAEMPEAAASILTSPVAAALPAVAGIPLQGASAMANNIFNFSGPVTINVMAPAAAAPAETAAKPPLAAPGFIEKKQTFDPDYSTRSGYDDMFLGVRISPPTVVPARAEELFSVADYKAFLEADRQVPEVDTGGMDDAAPFLLHYHHYSLCQNKASRMCMWTASNADYSDAQRQDTRERSAFGGEDWRLDPRVPTEMQLQNDEIYGPGKRIDRGHIVRRDDNCWGAAGEETAFANADSYHWTNCTPQHEAFNQENPRDNLTGQTAPAPIYKGRKGIWGEFEGVVQKNLKDSGGQAVIFAGPVLDDSVKTVTVDGVEIAVPTLFWKVVVVPASAARRPRLLAYGYVLSQADVIKKFGLQIQEALAVPPKFDKWQKSLAEISATTGVIFPDNVLAADQFGVA